MPITLKTAIERYLRSGKPAQRTRNEYATTLRRWKVWGQGVSIERLGRKDIREFLDWVYERAVDEQGSNPGRTANKAREHLRAVISWAWEQDLIEVPPRFPKPRFQRDVAGRHYLTKAELNALYFADLQSATTSRMDRSQDHWTLLASGACGHLQLRRRHGHNLEVRPWA